MNIHELDELLARLLQDPQDNAELIQYYQAERVKLINRLSSTVQNIVNEQKPLPMEFSEIFENNIEGLLVDFISKQKDSPPEFEVVFKKNVRKLLVKTV